MGGAKFLGGIHSVEQPENADVSLRQEAVAARDKFRVPNGPEGELFFRNRLGYLKSAVGVECDTLGRQVL